MDASSIIVDSLRAFSNGEAGEVNTAETLSRLIWNAFPAVPLAPEEEISAYLVHMLNLFAQGSLDEENMRTGVEELVSLAQQGDPSFTTAISLDAHVASEPTFSAFEAASTQRQLRTLLGLGEEAFPLPAFIGMLSDEIEKLLAAGWSDLMIAETLTGVTGKRVSAEAVSAYYACPAVRR